MDISTIASLVSSIGFPIVCCIALGWYVKYTIDQNRIEIQTIQAEHRMEMQEVTTALNNNTLAIQKLCNQLGGEKDDI